MDGWMDPLLLVVEQWRVFLSSKPSIDHRALCLVAPVGEGWKILSGKVVFFFFKRKQHASNFWILWSCCSIKSDFLVQRIASKFHERLEFSERQVADFYKEKIFHLMKGREITVVYWSDLYFVLSSAGSNKVRFFSIPLSDCCPLAQSSNDICPPVAGHTRRPVSLSCCPPKASYFSLVSG